jgi:hypothetical protein
MSIPYYISATGNVGPANGGRIPHITLTPAAAVATLVLRSGGSGGTIIWAGQAAANGSSVDFPYEPDPIAYSGQLHATIGGTGAQAQVHL